MQANNKGDTAQVYEGATRATEKGIKGALKYLLKPLLIFSYHHFVEGIKAVQSDGPTKELEKITNLSYDETIRVMEKCQKDGVRVVASERRLSSNNKEFGKDKSLYQQKRITKYARRIKRLSKINTKYPNISKLLLVKKQIEINKYKQKEQVEKHKNKHYNIYFNKSRAGYMGDRIADLIEYRTGISQKLFDEDTQSAIEEIKKEGMSLNSQQLKDLYNKFKLHEIGEVEIDEFKKDYCIHEMPFSAFMNIKDDLEASNIPYGMRVTSNDKEEQVANLYFENKHLEQYSDLGFTYSGQIKVYGVENKNIEWDINSQDDIKTFTTKTGEEEKETYSKLSGKNYIMKRHEDVCVWTVFKTELEELAEKEKKRDVVDEELQKYEVIEDNGIEMDKQSEIEVNLKDEKEVGD